MRKGVIALASVAVATALAGAAVAAVSPTAVKETPANEQNPAATSAWFAWTQSPADHPNRTNVWAEPTPVDGLDAFRVNPEGTRAWTGGIEGNQLVYQEIDSGDSDIRLHNLATNQPLPDEPINTARWEWHPTISTESSGDGDTWILFGRQNPSTWTQRILAWNVTDDLMLELASTTNRRNSLVPGQVNGDWATWTACTPNCGVRYVNLVDGSPLVRVPRPSWIKHEYGSSIAEDGTLYFVRSGRGCGANVRIMRRSAESTELLVNLPDRRDIFFAYADDVAGGTELYFDRVNCATGAWHIYSALDAP